MVERTTERISIFASGFFGSTRSIVNGVMIATAAAATVTT
jgi:hypothetical protein